MRSFDADRPTPNLGGVADRLGRNSVRTSFDHAGGRWAMMGLTALLAAVCREAEVSTLPAAAPMKNRPRVYGNPLGRHTR